MDTIAAYLIIATLIILGFFQILLALGKPYGRFAWGGQHVVLPRRLRIGSALSVLLYALIAYIALGQSGLVESALADQTLQTFSWVLFAYFALGVLMNGVSRSKQERFTMVPTSALLAASFLILAL